MIVVIAGMQRSGSTFSFNVARELLGVRGGVNTYATNSLEPALLASEETRHAVIKTHAPDLLLNAILHKKGFPCICTIRKPEDAIASWMDVFGFSVEQSVEMITEWICWHRKMHSYMLNIKYEHIDEKPIIVINNISRYLLGNSYLIEIFKIWRQYRKSKVQEMALKIEKEGKDAIDIGFSHYDRETFFHRRHVSALESRPASAVVSAEQLLFIRGRLSAYTDSNGEYHW